MAPTTEAQGLSWQPPALVAQPPQPQGRLRRLANWLPYWAIALLLLIPGSLHEYAARRWLWRSLSDVPLADQVFVVCLLFLPGAIKRWSWRHALVMTLAGGAAWGIVYPLRLLSWPQDTLFPFRLWAEITLLVLMVGLAESLLTHKASRQTLAWIGGASLGVASGLCVIVRLIFWCDWLVYVPTGQWSRTSWALSRVVYVPLMALLCWLAVPEALRTGPQTSRLRRLMFSSAAGFALAIFILFFSVLAYPLAEWSLTGSGPVAKYNAAWILDLRGRESDYEMIWRELEKSDWETPLLYASDAFLQRPDWCNLRSASVEILARHDPAGTAEKLSGLLLSKPSAALAEVAAPVLAQNRRYETAPVLMRYALHGNIWWSGEQCEKALEQMQVPQVAAVLLHQAAIRAYSRHIDPGSSDFEIDQELRVRLVAILGQDAGPNFKAWARLYDEVVNHVPTPVPDTIRSETNWVVHCFTVYWKTYDRWYSARRRLCWKMLADDGKAKEIEPFTRWYRAHEKQDRPPEPDNDALIACRTLETYLDASARALAVGDPDWNVPTTDDLAREIDAYAARVDAAIEQHLGKADAAASGATPDQPAP